MVSLHDVEPTGPVLDLTGPPTHECICGSNMFKVIASFEDYEVASFLTEGECVECGSRLTVPTPIDKPGYKPDSLAF